MRRSPRLVAEGEAPPSASSASPGQARGGQLRRAVRAVGRPAGRGAGVAWQLVQAGADAARTDGRSHLAYWVGTDNGRAVAFASGFGFRPTDTRRPMRVQSEEDGEEEIAMVLPLGDDRRGRRVASAG